MASRAQPDLALMEQNLLGLFHVLNRYVFYDMIKLFSLSYRVLLLWNHHNILASLARLDFRLTDKTTAIEQRFTAQNNQSTRIFPVPPATLPSPAVVSKKTVHHEYATFGSHLI